MLVVDSAHGHSANVIETVKEIKKRWDIDVVAGNVATAEGCRDLIDAGADAVKVGIGPGSICTTRVISGVGVPQITAIYDAAAGGAEARRRRSSPTAAFATRATSPRRSPPGRTCVMIGGLFAGLAESPGRTRSCTKDEPSRPIAAWVRWGRWSKAPANATAKPAANAGTGKLVPEGVEGRVPFKGPLSRLCISWSAACGPAWATAARRTIEELRTEARFIQVSPASVRESHPHDIAITQEAPNYTAEFNSVDGG